MRIALPLLLLAGVLLEVPAWADNPPPASAASRQPGTPRTTAGGTTFTLPAGWTATQRGAIVEIRPPETDLTLGLTDVDAKDASAAVTAAWASYDPGFKRAVHVATPAGPRDGWQEREFVDYEVSPNEKLVIAAFAWRANNRWLVGMLRASEATREKRAGPLNVAINSLRPKGYQRESFAGRKAHPIDAQLIATMKAFVADGMAQLEIPGVGFSLIDGGQGRIRGRPRCQRAGQPGAGRRRHAVHRRLEHQGDDDAAARATRGREEAALGRARHRGLSHLQARRRGYHAAGAHQAPGLRLHGHAAPGPRVGLPVSARDATRGGSSLAGMQPTSKFGEVFQYSNLMAAAAGFIGGTIAVPNVELGAAYDEAMQRRIFDAARHDAHHLRFPAGDAGNRAQPARRRHRWTAAPVRAWSSTTRSSQSTGGWRVDQRARPVPLRDDGACAGAARRRQAPRLRGEPPRAPRAASPRERRRRLRHGPHHRQALGHAHRAPRRRSRGLPQRHALAARLQRRRRHPHQREPGLPRCAGPSRRDSSSCSSKASRKPRPRSRGSATQLDTERAKDRERLQVPPDAARVRRSRRTTITTSSARCRCPSRASS